MLRIIQKTALMLCFLALSTSITFAQEGRAVTVEDWEARLPLLFIIMVGTVIITAFFVIGALRRMNDADYK